jgi:hypothetical protein
MATFYEIDGRHINLDAIAEVRPDYGENWVRLYTTGGGQLPPIWCDDLDADADEVIGELLEAAEHKGPTLKVEGVSPIRHAIYRFADMEVDDEY